MAASACGDGALDPRAPVSAAAEAASRRSSWWALSRSSWSAARRTSVSESLNLESACLVLLSSDSYLGTGVECIGASSVTSTPRLTRHRRARVRPPDHGDDMRAREPARMKKATQRPRVDRPDRAAQGLMKTHPGSAVGVPTANEQRDSVSDCLRGMSGASDRLRTHVRQGRGVVAGMYMCADSVPRNTVVVVVA
jgi:hypothetical protein